MNKIKHTLTAAMLASGLAIINASATTVMVDFGTGSSPVQSGFDAQTTGAATTYSTVAGDITIASNGNFFNRSAGGGYNEAALMGDFNFLNSFGTMTISVEGPGIVANTDYEIQFWSYDSQHGGGGGTVTYTGVSGTVGSTSIAYSSGNLDPNTNTSTSTWTSNGSGQILIDITGTVEGPRVNGIAITVVPETSTSALFGLGGLALICRRRK